MSNSWKKVFSTRILYHCTSSMFSTKIQRTSIVGQLDQQIFYDTNQVTFVGRTVPFFLTLLAIRPTLEQKSKSFVRVLQYYKNDFFYSLNFPRILGNSANNERADYRILRGKFFFCKNSYKYSTKYSTSTLLSWSDFYNTWTCPYWSEFSWIKLLVTHAI